MAWTTPVTNRTPASRTTAADMNRIVGNISALGGAPIKEDYNRTDIVTIEEWQYICGFVADYNPDVTEETTYTNLNEIEKTLQGVYDHSHKLFPAINLYPASSLYPDTEV